MEEKIKRLESIIARYNSAIVAYSGGVDSTLLCYYVSKVLKDKFLAVTTTSEVYTDYELDEARSIAGQFNWPHEVIYSTEIKSLNFTNNNADRCKWCKDIRFKELLKMAQARGYDYVLAGDNMDDLSDYRPGYQHAKTLGIISPLIEAGLNKTDIRKLAKEAGLPNYNKPANPCLATRIPYGIPVSTEALKMIKAAEDCLHNLGYTTVRVRHHNNLARIEIEKAKILQFISFHGDLINKQLKEIGYHYVTLDLNGYRSGSLNEVLEDINGQ